MLTVMTNADHADENADRPALINVFRFAVLLVITLCIPGCGRPRQLRSGYRRGNGDHARIVRTEALLRTTG